MMEQIHASKNGAGTTGLPSAKKKKNLVQTLRLKLTQNGTWT